MKQTRAGPVMVTPTAKRRCLYCGEPTKRGKKGEHVIPEAIGGAFTLNDVPDRSVCPRCNSGILSQLDKELCSRSYLSVIASREIGAHLWQAWDVDHKSDNLLLEARPAWGADGSMNALVCYPQITFERLKGPAVHGDSEEFQRFVPEEASKVLFQAVRRCFVRHLAGETGALNFERVRSDAIYRGYRLSPRIFTPHPIGHVARNVRKQSFVLRFGSEEDKYFALQSIRNLSDEIRLRNWIHSRGSHYPTLCVFFDIADTLRALMKLGVNLIAAHCPNTPVNRQSFLSAIRVIRGEAGQIPPRVMMSNGFIHAEDIPDIKATGREHSFRLVHVEGVWHIYSSFFGGQIGSYVCLPGPNHEDWRCAEIVAPLGSKGWTVRRSPILPYMKRVRVVWKDGMSVMPSVKLQKCVSSLRLEQKRLPRTK